MIWLELRVNDHLYNEGWNFSESVWAPTKKSNGSNWPFWNTLKQVAAGDIIFHLKETNGRKQFLGYSTAISDGYVTYEKPATEEHAWSFSNSYYRVDIENYKPLPNPINLNKYFADNNEYLRQYFIDNSKSSVKERLFFVIQSGRLQYLNGAYFSEFSVALANLLVAESIDAANQLSEPFVPLYTATGSSNAILSQRVGHQQFSDNVKRNFNYKCCFPDCNVEGNSFLVSGHIARWADNELLRGETSNGLCLCLMHDKAFEKGLFTLSAEFKIKLLINRTNTSEWLFNILNYGDNKEIKYRHVNPSLEALSLHWERIGLTNTNITDLS